jgi:hypothetical protein
MFLHNGKRIEKSGISARAQVTQGQGFSDYLHGARLIGAIFGPLVESADKEP